MEKANLVRSDFSFYPICGIRDFYSLILGFLLDTIKSNLISILIIHLPLPIGISFYTFQILSYVIDIYLGKVPVQNIILWFVCNHVSQLIAGPIVQARILMISFQTGY